MSDTEKITTPLGNVAVATFGTIRDMSERQYREEGQAGARQREALRGLAAGIAHDFNTLLLTILDHISLAKMAAQPHESITAHLTEAEKECARARVLIHQLLTFSQGTVPTRHTISMAELLDEATRFVFQGSNVRGVLTKPYTVAELMTRCNASYMGSRGGSTFRRSTHLAILIITDACRQASGRLPSLTALVGIPGHARPGSTCPLMLPRQ